MGYSSYIYIGPYIDVSNLQKEIEIDRLSVCDKCKAEYQVSANFCMHCGGNLVVVKDKHSKAFSLSDVEHLYDNVYDVFCIFNYCSAMLPNWEIPGTFTIDVEGSPSKCYSFPSIEEQNNAIVGYTSRAAPIFDYLKSQEFDVPKTLYGIVYYTC